MCILLGISTKIRTYSSHFSTHAKIMTNIRILHYCFKTIAQTSGVQTLTIQHARCVKSATGHAERVEP